MSISDRLAMSVLALESMSRSNYSRDAQEGSYYHDNIICLLVADEISRNWSSDIFLLLICVVMTSTCLQTGSSSIELTLTLTLKSRWEEKNTALRNTPRNHGMRYGYCVLTDDSFHPYHTVQYVQSHRFTSLAWVSDAVTLSLPILRRQLLHSCNR